MSVTRIQPPIRDNCRKLSPRRQPHRQSARSASASSRRIQSLRDQITRGDYDLDGRLRVSIDRLIDAVFQ